jgi:hypothetical protein
MIDLGVSLDGIENIGPKVRTGVERFMLDGAQAGQNRAMEEVPEDRGNLRQSMAQFVPEVRDGDVVWGVGGQSHALPMEYGTDPGHIPPIRPLIEWSRRQGMDEGFAWYVQHKIEEEGVEPHPFLRPGAETQSNWYSSHDISNYIDKELR